MVTGVEWEQVGVGVTVGIALLSAHAYLMRIIINNAILALGKTISEDYVTKEDFNRHIEHCSGLQPKVRK